MRISKIALVAAAMVVSAGSLQAQVNCAGTGVEKAGFPSCITTTELTANVPFLAVINKNISSAALPAATIATMDGYSAAVAGPTLNIKANFVWTLTASMGGFAQVTAQGVNYTKANADLEITNTASGDTDWMTFAANRTLALTQTATATQDVVTRYRVAYSWAKDLPGAYSATVTYTLTAP
jgi:hypothetical protein